MTQAKVYVIDDEFETLAFMEQVITEAGHQVETFTDGNQAVEKMQTSTPDMVFLDLQMPRINGFQVLKAMRQVRRLDDVPVVLLSALSAVTGSEYCPETLEARYGVRPDAFVSKPVLPEAVDEQLQMFIRA
jgi:twitching motility two-component system response regulator PilH